MILIVMGVSGSGKTSVGLALAQRLGAPFLDADELHPPENVAKMTAGTALDDGDRAPWIDAVTAQVAAAEAEGRDLVVACSALRRSARDRLRETAPVRFVHLQGAAALLQQRVDGRSGHFMPSTLLDSQLATLEPPEDEPSVLTLDAALPVAELAEAAAGWAERGD